MLVECHDGTQAVVQAVQVEPLYYDPPSGEDIELHQGTKCQAVGGVTCEICGKAFSVPNQLWHHMRYHRGDHRPACEVCGKRFSQTSHLKDHMRQHTGEKPFKYHLRDRMEHEEGKAGQPSRPHVCEHCHKCFKQRNHLRDHLRIHTGERPFVCHVCDQRFTIKGNLKRHLKNWHSDTQSAPNDNDSENAKHE